MKTNRSINSNNANRKVDGRVEAKIIEIACAPVPDGHSRWTIRLLEERMKVELDEPISREAIRRSIKKQASTSPQQLLVSPKHSGCRIYCLYGRCTGCI